MFEGFEMFINFEGLSIPETPSSFILPVNERSLLLNSSVYFGIHSAPARGIRYCQRGCYAAAIFKPFQILMV